MTSRAFAFVAACAIVLILPTAASAEGITPIKRALPDSAQYSVDGTDLYWLEGKTSGNPRTRTFSVELVLYRGSLLDKSKVELAHFDLDGNEVPESITQAGAVSISTSAIGRASTVRRSTTP